MDAGLAASAREASRTDGPDPPPCSPPSEAAHRSAVAQDAAVAEPSPMVVDADCAEGLLPNGASCVRPAEPRRLRPPSSRRACAAGHGAGGGAFRRRGDRRPERPDRAEPHLLQRRCRAARGRVVLGDRRPGAAPGRGCEPGSPGPRSRARRACEWGARCDCRASGGRSSGGRGSRAGRLGSRHSPRRG